MKGLLLVLVCASAALADAPVAPAQPATAAPAKAEAANPDAPKADAAKPQPPKAGDAKPDDTLMRSGPNDLPDDVTSPSSDAGEMNFGWMLVRTFVVLGIVVALIYLSLNVGLRRLMGIRSVAGGNHSSVIEVLERVPLDQKRALFVVKAAGEYLLLGAGEGSMNLLSKLSKEEIDKIQREAPKPTLSLSPFLQKLLTRRGP